MLACSFTIFVCPPLPKGYFKELNLNYRVLWIFLLIVTSFDVYASGRWISKGTIEGVYVDTRASYQRVIFRHSLPRENDECSNNGDYYELDMSAEIGKHAMSFVLSAEATKKEVVVYLEGCSPTGFPYARIVSSITS